MAKKMRYLTIEQKRNYIRQGKKIPLRVQGDGRSLSLISKLRGTIFDGSLKNKRMGL